MLHSKDSGYNLEGKSRERDRYEVISTVELHLLKPVHSLRLGRISLD